jgi:plastocyanin
LDHYGLNNRSDFDVRATSKIFGLIVLAISASCGGGDSSTGGYGGITDPGGTPLQTTSVAVSDNQFSPASIQVSPGATVTWTWIQNASQHNVTFTTGTPSANLSSNATYTRNFPTAGTFTYQCTIHPGMTGTVKVQ